MNETAELLRKYIQTGCEDSFRQLVEQHLGLVYATALRRMSGDAAAAKDAAQIVFSDLARKARTLPPDVCLAGWLYKHTCLKSAEAIRSETRRRNREQIAAEMNTINSDDALWREVAPTLDVAMQQLNAADRDALILRFFQNTSLRDLGQSFGVSEDAAQKRISRALDRLREQLARHGVTCSAALLATTLSANAAPIAPLGMAASIAGAALAGATSLSLLETLTLLMTTKAKTILIGAVILGAATTIVLQNRTNKQLEQRLGAIERQETTKQNLIPSNNFAVERPTNQFQPLTTAAAKTKSFSELMQTAISLTSSARPREETVKEIEPLLAQIPIGEIKQAADMALQIGDSNWRMGFLHMLLKRWAGSDGPAALAYLSQNIKGQFQAPLLAAALPAWAANDPESAWNWYQTTGRKELQFDARGMHNTALNETFAAMSRVDFDRSIGRALELRGIDLANAFQGLAYGAQTPGQQLQLLDQVDHLQNADQDYVRGVVLNNWASKQPDEARAYIEGLANAAQRSLSAQHIGPALMGPSPEKGAEWWLNQTTDSDRPKAIKEIMQRWTEADLVGAARWLQTQGNGPEADVAKRAFINAAMMRAPGAAMSWANSLSHPNQRAQTMHSIYNNWLRQNSAEAEQWLSQANLPPEMMAVITNR